MESQSLTPLSMHTHDVLGTALGAWDSAKEKQTKTCPKAEVVLSSQCILWSQIHYRMVFSLRL